MSIEQAEQLKRELTDKYVIVDKSVPWLRRFVGLTGRVKTVNMNCRALVEFDSPEDISWYDIEPKHLRIVDAPLPKTKTAAAEKPAAKASPAPAGTAKPSATGKLSPLELARQQAAAAKGNAGDTPPAGDAAPAGKKLSPLEQARQQVAAKQAALAGGDGTKPDAQPSTAPSTAPAQSPAGKKLSPLELARQQDKK